jgi:glycosyltransferase involved in cell wall biosynthesis
MPTYNGADYLADALSSVLEQRDPNLEVIAIDDGSTDATPSILADFADRLPLTILNRRVGSWVENTNLGIERANGDWITFLHQDDLWRPGRLAALRSAIDSDAALILHAADFVDRRGRRVGRWRCPLQIPRGGSPPATTVSRLLVQNFVPLPVALFRRADALRVGALNPKLWFTADWDFWLKLSALGSTRYLPESLAAFRLHPQSQTVARTRRSAELREQYQIVFDVHWPIWRDRLLRPKRVEIAARLSREINAALAARQYGESINWKPLLQAMAVGPVAWSFYLHNSRIWERAVSRLRARL